MNSIIIAFVIAMTFIGAIASLFLKRASSNGSFIIMLCDYNIYVGGTLYVLAALINIYVLKFLPYTVVLPLTSMTYIWTMIISGLILKENIGKRKITGVALILIGAMLISISLNILQLQLQNIKRNILMNSVILSKNKSCF